MTREQHLEAARRAGQIACSNNWRAVSDHPFDNDQDQCADDAVLWATIAAHHAIQSMQCGRCYGRGWAPDHGPMQEIFVAEDCPDCDGIGWVARES